MEALGIDIKILLAQIVNFAIVLVLLKKFLYKPLVTMLEDRKDKIAQGISDSEKAKIILENAEKEATKTREKAFKEAKELVENAKQELVEKSVQIIKKANDQADQIVKRAEDEAALAKGKALSEAKGEISNIVVLALDKIVGNELDQSQKANLTAKAIREL